MMNPVEIAFEVVSFDQYNDHPAPVVIAGICDDGKPALCPPLADSNVETALAELAEAAGFEGNRDDCRLITAGSDVLPRAVVLVGLGKRERLDRLGVERAFAHAARRLRGGEFPAVTALPALDWDFAHMLGPVVDGLMLGSYKCATYVSENAKKEAKPVEKVFVVAEGDRESLNSEIKRARVCSKATNVARDLANAPGLDANPPALADHIVDLCKKAGLQAEVWKYKKILAQGMNLLLAVGRGSQHEPRFVKITYKPEKRTSKQIVLVGKGVTFDTGGIDLKKPQGMDSMRGDKGGAAAIVAAMLAAQELKPGVKLTALIPLAENMPDAKAYRPSDVFESASGKTVEIGDTDAEGRLILADALHYASTMEPDAIVDLATLTGSCMVGLGTQVAGLFANDEELAERLLQASDLAGERLWPLPLETLYRPELDSEVADIRNVGDRYGDAVHAALFLSEFVGECAWAHLDIAGPAWLDKEFGGYPVGATGYGVRTLCQFLLSQDES